MRELRLMTSRPVYMVMMVIVPLMCCLFLVTLMHDGLPQRTPTGIIDMDQSQLSRQVTRNLNAGDLVDIQYKLESYNEALSLVREGKIFGFFIIPENFERDAIAGNEPTLEYYTNMTFFIPGTLSFKGFKTVAVTTAGGLVNAKLTTMGATPAQASALIQPVIIDTHPIGNPWTNYSYYLTPSFGFATIALLIMLFTAYSITVEIKRGTSVEWLRTADNNIMVALYGKLLPQALVWIITCLAFAAMIWGYCHFPLHGNPWWLLAAIILFVLATQSLAAFVVGLLPNPRLSMSVLGLIAVLTYSFAGFSFPTESMYGAIAIFSYIVPVRYLFLIYVNSALNGFDIYYVRYCYAALLFFLLLAPVVCRNLKRAALNPVYVP